MNTVTLITAITGASSAAISVLIWLAYKIIALWWACNNVTTNIDNDITQGIIISGIFFAIAGLFEFLIRLAERPGGCNGKAGAIEIKDKIK